MIYHLLFFIALTGIGHMSDAKIWRNWAGNQSCEAKVITPKNKQELINLVKKAQRENKKIHAFGSRHSWSNIVCVPDGYLVDTSKLNKILAVDTEKHQVTVEAGIKVEDLNKKLEKLNLSLSNQGAITKQSLAGIISTATHGSGHTGTLASFVIGAELLTADGKLVTISHTENKEYFPAVRTSLGALGIITQLTVQCEPLFKLKQEYRTTGWDYFIKNYEKLLAENNYIQFHWSAYDDSVLMKMHNRVSDDQQNTLSSKPSKILGTLKDPHINYSYKLLAGVLNQKYVEIEIAIPRAKFVKAAQAARKLVRQEYEKNSDYNGILFRFVSADTQNLLSPASNQDVVYFSFIPASMTDYEPFFKKYYDLLLTFGGRPHWGKINFLTQQDAKKLYGKNLDQFIKIRKELDPAGLFSNSFTQKIFGT